MICIERPDFLSGAECQELTDWSLSSLHSAFFRPVCGRVSTRQFRGAVDYPEIAFAVRDRIEKLFGFDGHLRPPFPHGFYSGVSRNSKEYAYEPHKDPTYHPGTKTVHCNVVTTDSPGGEVFIQGHGLVSMTKGKLVVYPVSEVTHQVMPGLSEAPRNLWVFGFCPPKDFVVKAAHE